MGIYDFSRAIFISQFLGKWIIISYRQDSSVYIIHILINNVKHYFLFISAICVSELIFKTLSKFSFSFIGSSASQFLSNIISSIDGQCGNARLHFVTTNALNRWDVFFWLIYPNQLSLFNHQYQYK